MPNTTRLKMQISIEINRCQDPVSHKPAWLEERDFPSIKLSIREGLVLDLEPHY